MPGRKAKPTHIKLLEGNPGKRPLPTKEPKPERGKPPCPSHLPKRAKKVFRSASTVLDAMGVLTVADGQALELLALAVDEYHDAREVILAAALEKHRARAKSIGETLGEAAERAALEAPVDQRLGLTYATITPNGIMIRNHPAVAIRSDAWRRARAMLSEFGLTPSSRTKVQVIGGDEADPFEEFMKRGQQGQQA